MASKTVNLILRLKDGVTPSLSKMQKGMKTAGLAFSKLAKVGTVALAGLTVAIGAVGVAIKKSFEFETARTQLKGLLGSIDEANKRFQELRDFAAETPFQLPELLDASKKLTVFTEGALGSAESLRAIGDAAATTGNGISDVSFWVGRAYSMLKGGKPFGEAAMRLQEMGILTPEVRQQMEDLQASGADFEVVWSKLTDRMGEFNGGMKDLSQTGAGLVSTLKDNWGIALAEFGDEFVDVAKNDIVVLTRSIQDLVKSGAIKDLADVVVPIFSRWSIGVVQLVENLSKVARILGNIKENASVLDIFIPGKMAKNTIDAFKKEDVDSATRNTKKREEEEQKALEEMFAKQSKAFLDTEKAQETTEQAKTEVAKTESKKRVEIAKEEAKEVEEAQKPSGDTVKYNITDKIKAFYEERRKSGNMDLTGGSSIAPGDLQREGLTGEGTSFADFMAGGAKGGDVTTGNYKFPFDAVTSLEGGDATSGVLDTVSGMAGDASGIAQENPMEKIEKILQKTFDMQDKRMGGVK